MLWLFNHGGRILHRVRYGYWCHHLVWTKWRIIDGGRYKTRRCKVCTWREVV